MWGGKRALTVPASSAFMRTRCVSVFGGVAGSLADHDPAIATT